MFGFYRFATAVPEVSVANASLNEARIFEVCNDLQKHDVAVALFPELSLSGYTCADLFQSQSLLDSVWLSLEKLATASRSLKSIIIVGAPISFLDRLYNCAVVIQGGEIKGVVPKAVIPNYREFYEKRWFSSGRNIADAELVIGGRKIPFGCDLIFAVSDQFVFGIEICEDLWAPEPMSVSLAAAGAQLIFNLSASNAVIGKADYRRQLVASQSARLSCAYVYVSAGPTESTTDLVFSGHSLAAEYGQILLDHQYLDTVSGHQLVEIDVDRLKGLRRAEGSYADVNPSSVRVVTLLPVPSPKTITRPIDPHPFVPSAKEDRALRCAEVFELQSLGLYKRLQATGIKSVVLGLSGGLDSTLAALVCTRVRSHFLPDLKIYAVSMPGYGTSDRTKANAALLATQLDLEFSEIDIRNACAQHFKDIGHDGISADVTFENVQARERTQILMDLANKQSALVIGTGDLSEIALGWSTYGGDHLSMYAVNCSVPKTLLRHVIAYLAEIRGGALKTTLLDILSTPVSPELLPKDLNKGEIAQRTEDILGPYELHDFFMYHFLRYGCATPRLIHLAKLAFVKLYDEAFIRKTLKVFYRRFFSNQFKRNCIPDGPKVGTISLSPRGDWRMPSDAAAATWLDAVDAVD